MNAISPDDVIRPAILQDALRREIFWNIPYDKKVRQGTHLGQPIVITAPQSAAARSLTDLATVVAGGHVDSGRKVLGGFKWRPAPQPAPLRKAEQRQLRQSDMPALLEQAEGRGTRQWPSTRAGKRRHARTSTPPPATASGSMPCTRSISGCCRRWTSRAIEKLDAEQRARGRRRSRRGSSSTQQFPSILGDDREHVIRRVIDEAIGFGPIQPLLDDDSVSEVMVNAPDELFFERDGIIYLSPLRFRTTATSCGSSSGSSRRSAAASTSRRRTSMRACPTARA